MDRRDYYLFFILGQQDEITMNQSLITDEGYKKA
jgi:hypothetical protein